MIRKKNRNTMSYNVDKNHSIDIIAHKGPLETEYEVWLYSDTGCIKSYLYTITESEEDDVICYRDIEEKVEETIGEYIEAFDIQSMFSLKKKEREN